MGIKMIVSGLVLSVTGAVGLSSMFDYSIKVAFFSLLLMLFIAIGFYAFRSYFKQPKEREE